MDCYLFCTACSQNGAQPDETEPHLYDPAVAAVPFCSLVVPTKGTAVGKLANGVQLERCLQGKGE
jgi:hypothetical protein